MSIMNETDDQTDMENRQEILNVLSSFRQTIHNLREWEVRTEVIGVLNWTETSIDELVAYVKSGQKFDVREMSRQVSFFTNQLLSLLAGATNDEFVMEQVRALGINFDPLVFSYHLQQDSLNPTHH